MSRALWLCAGLAVLGCATGSAIVPAAELGEAGGTPSISAVEDRGGGDIQASGSLPSVAGDGRATIGEVVLIRGRNFGRQPTVNIGGQAATVVSRIDDGGILTRVPAGAAGGRQVVSVTTEYGRGEALVAVQRLAVARVGDQLSWIELPTDDKKGGPTRVGEITIAGLRAIAVSSDGRAAYAVDGNGTLQVFELPGLRGPTARGKLSLPTPVRALLAPTGGRQLYVVGADDIIEIDTRAPLVPVILAKRPLPNAARGTKPIHAAASPDGRRLAFAIERNRILVADVAELRTGHEPVVAELGVVTSTLAPVIADMTFSPDGETVWIASGVTAENRSFGPQPTLVHAVRVSEPASPPGPVGLVAARTVKVGEATLPQAIATGQSTPLASGAAIRLPPERATVHLAAYGIDGSPRVFSIGADDVATPALVEKPQSFISRPEVSSDEAWMLALCGDAGGAWRLVALRLKGGEMKSIDLGPGAARPTNASAVGVKVQP